MHRTTIFFEFRVGPRSRQSRSTAAPGLGFFPIRALNQGFDPRGGRPDNRGPPRPSRRGAGNQGATDVLMSAEASYDVVIVGAGPGTKEQRTFSWAPRRAMTSSSSARAATAWCAVYLARAGLRVNVVERRAVVGNAAVTAEFHPGSRISVKLLRGQLAAPQCDRRSRFGPPRPRDP